MNCLDAACGNLILKFGIAAIAAVAVFAFLAYRAKRSRKASKLDLIVSAMLLGTFTFGMINEGVVTQEDKEEYRGAIARTAAERTAMASILLPEGRDMASLETSPSATGDDAAALAKKSSHDADSSGTGQNLRDAQQGIADSDYEAGFVLAEVRTSEVHDFSAPTNAVWHRDWLDHGGIGDNFRLEFGGLSFPFGTNAISALTVFQRGLMRPRTVDAASFIAPLQAWLGAVPECSHSLLPEMSRPSGFWHCFTPSNSVVMTWRNFLLGRDALHPVTLQAELFEDGCAEFRYDLSQAGAETISNIVAGIRCDSLGTTLDSLDANVTTIRWQRLNPEDVANPDPDNDGISTCDEIFVYHTNPYNADSDYDGVSDYDEINVHSTDPNNAHSVSQLYCDSFALVLGDEDPFACPEGSTNTIYEHIVYTGTTNAPFAYPQSSEDGAVLEITVSGTGTGEMILGDRVIPLIAPPQMRSGAATCRLFENVGYGVKKQLWFRKPDGLDAALRSDELLIGEFPSLTRWKGWIAFPHTDATIPCIHDFASCGKTVSLVHGVEFPGLTATWESEAQGVAIANVPPVSAEIYGRFPKTQTRTISYTIGHPDYQSGQTTFTQTLRFCPQIEEEDAPPGSQEVPDTENGWAEEEEQGLDETSEADAEGEYDRISALPVAQRVLQLYGDLGRSDTLSLDVPNGEPVRCCDCPDHCRSNYVAVAAKSWRLSVLDSSGGDFVISHNDVGVEVCGRHPSREPLGDGVLFVTNGAPMTTRSYTVLGVNIETPSGPSLPEYNAKSASLGFPITAGTNLDYAASLRLRTDVLLSNGVFRLAVEDATVPFQIWTKGAFVWDAAYGATFFRPPELVLDSAASVERHFTMRQWRDFCKFHSEGRTLDVLVVSLAQGSCDLAFSYEFDQNGHSVGSSSRQRVTAVKPPLLPDYDRGGRVNAMDVNAYLACRKFPFWVNNDTWRGDDAFDGVAAHLSPPSLPTNDSDDVVNGRNDLVNFLPLALDLVSLRQAWGNSVSFEICSPAPESNAPRFALQDISWKDVLSVCLSDTMTIDGVKLHESPLRKSAGPQGSTNSSEIPLFFLSLADGGRGVVTMEFPAGVPWVGVRAKDRTTGTTLYEFRLPLIVMEIGNFVHWINLHSEQWPLPSVLGSPEAWPDGDESVHSDEMVVFVHGYNVHVEEAWDWGTTVFKRLWRLGLDAGFAIVAWPGNEGQMWIPGSGYATPDFYKNAQNAFEKAPLFASYCNALPGERKYYIAHSLGNMIVSAAAQDWGLEYEKFLMLDAAVPIEAYDPSPETRAEAMTPNAWKPYERRVRPTCWYDLFPQGDGRRLLTWKGRFASVTNTVNYFSREEEVVNNGDGKRRNPFRRNFVWHNQEYRKGWCVTSSHKEGGWVFNPAHDTETPIMTPYGVVNFRRHLTPEGAAALPSELIMTNSFFGPFANTNIYGHAGGALVSDNYSYRAMLLTHSIPSESYAVGANPVPAWGAERVKGSRNIDMAQFKNGVADLPKKKQKWVHSYFINRSLNRTRELYESIMQKIDNDSEQRRE